jgi:hypothetical protein|tara:strand:+ start:11144 stop:11440 length:297 start_codon:yes stop_codon:yes gene_type:complete
MINPFSDLKRTYAQKTINKERPAPHQRAHEINEICELLGEDRKKNFGKWLGFTKGIPVQDIFVMRNEAYKNGKPPKALFIWLVRDWRKKYGSPTKKNC